VWSWAAREGQTRWDLAAAQPGSAGAGWERQLTGRVHASARGEREGTEDRKHESKKKMYDAKYAKGTLKVAKRGVNRQKLKFTHFKSS
jgi:hypothetical protein